jgi:RNA polymerase sigma-70 factor (ECF subfamily)
MTDPLSHQRKVIAGLVRRYGPHRIEEILDAVQVASLKLIEDGGPDQLLRTMAERRLIDQLRRSEKEAPLTENLPEDLGTPDDKLRLYFLLCNAKLTPIEQISLMLNALTGLNSGEISKLLLESSEATQKRITRAKQKLIRADFEDDLDLNRLPSVLKAIYLIFTAGHESAIGPEHLRVDLALIALNLAEDLDALTRFEIPEISALLALIHFNLSRFPARIQNSDEVVLLEDQDSAKYSQKHLALGFRYLESAQRSTDLTKFHLEAGMAASIAVQDTASVILQWNELLVRHYPSPMVRLSHAIATGKAEGADRGIAALDELRWDAILVSSPHFHAAYGYFYAELHQNPAAAQCYRTAISLSMSDPIKRTFEKRLSVLEDRPHDVAE